ncbi:MAG: recombinase [Bacteroidetes bacterium]|nr:MAG: recombinase [Bacteroidota bacterium]
MRVHLRKRKQTSKGRISLFLEIYKGSSINLEGKTKTIRDYEYLNLYLVDNPKDNIERQQNKETLKLASNIKAKRELDIQNGQYGFITKTKSKADFIDYFKHLAQNRLESKGNYGNWDSALKHLINFSGNRITFQEIDEHYCSSFLEHLTKKAVKKNGGQLSSSSVASYYSKIKAALHQAVKDRIIVFNPSIDVKVPRVIQKEREFLTIEEVRAIEKEECRYDVLKRAFLFSCLTGLRWSDIHKLTWGEIEASKEGVRITFHQQKTRALEYLDISEEAFSYLGEPNQNKSEIVFVGLKYSAYMNVALSRWVLKAGVTKNITFHCARHTFATMLLTYDTDIYTVSKLLGHSELKTTQVYARIIDKKKQEAVKRIPSIKR